MIADLAFNMIGSAPVSFYQGLSDEASKHIVLETEIDCMFGFDTDLTWDPDFAYGCKSVNTNSLFY